jgi:hypothetical protein
MKSPPKRRSRFSGAPKDLLDISYIIAVAAGEREPDRLAWPLFGDRPPRAEDYTTRQAAYGLGYHQGWSFEVSGRMEVPTPPVGMARNLLPAFCAGILDGADNARMAKALSRPAVGNGDGDRFAHLDGDFSAI